ncbi:hypothetical protein ACLM44_06285 [Synechococcus sp. W2B2]|uniref:hypothetical protein n=1 Tax=unclassified Synechococcus TaxID=2626047 RepID=UPI001E64392E|nr:hypothetical protein [Synechococcus sp. WH 7805]
MSLLLMTSGDGFLATVHQLSQQLHTVSEIAESLTLRLLSLEQRIQQLEAQVDQPSVNDEESQHLLTESSDRLRHLHGLLSEEHPEPELRLVEASEEQVDETVYVDDPQMDHGDEQIVDDSDLDQEQINLLSA